MYTLIVTPKTLLPSLISIMKIKVLLNLGQFPLDLKITQSLTISIHSMYGNVFSDILTGKIAFNRAH